MLFLDLTCSSTEMAPIMTIVSTVIKVIQFGVPIILIVMGMLDLGKAVMSSKEEEIKKAQSLFIKRLIAGIVVFLVITIVKVVMAALPSELVGDEVNNCLKLLK